MTGEKLPVGGIAVGNANIGRLGITGFGALDFSLLHAPEKWLCHILGLHQYKSYAAFVLLRHKDLLFPPSPLAIW
jgi:hypothetical protein